MPPRARKNTRQKVFKSAERVTESDDASAPASPVQQPTEPTAPAPTATLTASSEAATPRPSARKAASKPAPKRKEPARKNTQKSGKPAGKQSSQSGVIPFSGQPASSPTTRVSSTLGSAISDSPTGPRRQFFDPEKENWSALETWKPILFPYEPRKAHAQCQFPKLKLSSHYNYMNLKNVKGFQPLQWWDTD
ncbi:uncharacterized protein P884DRAFT_333151 [Thermothelomyces heterothallicus CBS 202.75]|uniref:uncharacterized protein n=1 Tax=Thermothelomyces heterothallicus CBS 202.75 TaxID=1149848 RepID=UPI00374452EB